MSLKAKKVLYRGIFCSLVLLVVSLMWAVGLWAVWYNWDNFDGGMKGGMGWLIGWSGFLVAVAWVMLGGVVCNESLKLSE